jgi:hypothetical protein
LIFTLGLGTHKAVHRFAAHHHHAGGDAANAKSLAQLLLLVGVDLDQFETAIVVRLRAFPSSGPITLQGPHHGAQKSTSTGTVAEAATTSAVKVFNGYVHHWLGYSGRKSKITRLNLWDRPPRVAKLVHWPDHPQNL